MQKQLFFFLCCAKSSVYLLYAMQKPLDFLLQADSVEMMSRSKLFNLMYMNLNVQTRNTHLT